jgi:voltage-gated potassium channel
MSEEAEGMTAAAPVRREHGNAYNIFILVLTVYSLALMVLLLLPINDQTRQLVNLYDNVICIIFLVDFSMNLAASRPRRDYFITRRGWLDLLGSIPSFGFIPFTALFRLARLSRLARITRLLRGQAGKDLIIDVLKNRGQYATFITILLAGMVLSVASILVLQEESRSANANITTGGDAIWWAIVTITTVGYGDFYPVTTLGRITAVFVMFSGIGIIGALASILASLLVSPGSSEGSTPEATPVPVDDGAPEAPAGAAAEPRPTRVPSPSPASPAVAAAAAERSAPPASDPPAAAMDPATSGAIMAELARLTAEVAELRASLAAARG